MSDDPPRLRRRAFLAAGAAVAGGCAARPFRGSGTDAPVHSPTADPTEDPSTETDATFGTTESPIPADPADATPRVGNDVGRLLEGFADAARWSPVNGETVLLDDGTEIDESPDPARGRQCLGVAGGSGAEIEGDFGDDPLDLAEQNFSFAFYPDLPDALTRIHATAFDGSGRAATFVGFYPGQYETGWIRHDLTAFEWDPEADLSAVTRLRIRVANDGPVRFWLDDVRATPKPDRGKVMFTFDNLWASQYDIGFDALQERDVRAAFSVITGSVGERDRITLDQLHEVEAAGCELISQGQGLFALAREAPGIQLRELKAAKEWLLENARNPAGAKHVVYPKHTYSWRLLETAAGIYEVGYVKGVPGAATLTDPLTVPRLHWRALSPADLKREVDRAANRRGLCALSFRNLDAERGDRERLGELLAYVEEADVDVVVPSELLELQGEFSTNA